jgi:hypothetical protein
MSGLWYDQDCTNAFFNSPLGKMNSGYFDKVVDATANSQVTRYFMCPGGSTTIFDGKYNEIYAKGFDLNQGPEQAAMCGSESEWLYRFAHNLHTMISQGIEPVQYILDRAKRKGMEAWITMRMNDIHGGEDDNSPFHCGFWKKHPEYRISDVPYENALNFACPEVQELILKRAFELIERFRADGLQMDWTRFPTYFPHGRGKECAHIITRIIRETRLKTGEKNLGFGVRVPGRIDICLERGLDLVSWAREGLIDYIVIAPFLLSVDFDLPVRQWREAIGVPDFPIIYAIEPGIRPYPGGEKRRMFPDEVRGVSSVALLRGADAVYLFNYFEAMQARCPDTFKEAGSLETLKAKDRTYRITWHDNEMTIGEQDKMNRFPGWLEKWRAEKKKDGSYPFALPETIESGSAQDFAINAVVLPGEKPECRLCLKFADDVTPEIKILLNGKPLSASGTSNEHSFSYELLQNDRNTVSIENKGKESIEVQDLRIKISFS